MSDVVVQRERGVTVVRLNRPDEGNQITVGLLAELLVALHDAERDTSCRAVVLTGSGDEFCRGLDLAGGFADGKIPNRQDFGAFVSCMLALRGICKPVLAAVQGPAMGGGLGLLAACDHVIASEHATFALPEVVVGMVPALIAPFLRERIVPAHMRSLALTSNPISATRAREIGLVDEVAVDHHGAVDRALSRILRSSPDALATTKNYLGTLADVPSADQHALALDTLVGWLSQPQGVEGIRAFASGESPAWFTRWPGGLL